MNSTEPLSRAAARVELARRHRVRAQNRYIVVSLKGSERLSAVDIPDGWRIVNVFSDAEVWIGPEP